jgi:hypothetical protein
VAYTPGRFNATELIDLPHAYASGYVATKVSNDFYNQFKPAEFKGCSCFLFLCYRSSGLIYHQETGEQAGRSQRHGFKIYRDGADIATALGASGYAAAQNEAYELMSKGVIDAV